MFSAFAIADCTVLRTSPEMRRREKDFILRLDEKYAGKYHDAAEDLLALRTDVDCALFAYAASAHRVMPLTRDGALIGTFATALDPRIMPAGDRDAAAEALGMPDLQAQAAAGIASSAAQYGHSEIAAAAVARVIFR